jgi:ATP-dependent Clp protease ATP-binding subunit ClpA
VFERCDTDTITIIDTAIDEARRLGHNYLGTEHLLFALVRRRDLLPDAVGSFLPEADILSSVLESFLAEPPSADADLLKTLGIDLEQVRAAVRQTFGSEALDRLGRRRVHQPWQPWRRPRRRCTSILGGSMGVAPRVKQALDYARRDADRRHQAAITPAGLLLGMVEVEDAVSNKLLGRVGVDPANVRRALLEAAD